ncbi:MAG: DUF547 domain-containing protein [Luteolibacter sp.]
MKSIFIFLFALSTLSLQAFDQTHAAFTEVLSKSVKGKDVDYAGLHKSPEKLGAYIETLAKVSESDFKSWSESEQIAYLINLYNAGTLKLIIDNYPTKTIRDIDKPWDQKRVKLFGNYASLNHIEHEILRKDYAEPRIHFGVNCASIGCPALRAEAFQGSKIDTQLDEQARGFLNNTSKNRVDKASGTLYLSSIFDWFKEDFIKKSGSVEKFVAPYFPAAEKSLIESGKLKVKFSDYDWNLNKS